MKRSSSGHARQTKQQFAEPDQYYLSDELGKAVQSLPPIYSQLVAVSLSLAVLGAIAWAALSQVDVVAETHGKLVPGEEVQPVRSPSGGKIKSVASNVTAGQQVQQGDPLVILDSAASIADIESLKQQAFLIKQDIQRNRTAAGESQRARINQAEIELAGLQNQLLFGRNKANRLRSIAGAISQLEVENAQREVSELETKVAAKQQEIQQLRQNYNTGPLSELNKRREELQAIERQLAQATVQNKQQTIVAPISGVVYNIKVNPTQGTVQAGEELLSIVPQGKSVVLEVDLPNQYKGFVDQGMKAKVKIDAFPYQEFGTIEGEVMTVSPNAVVKDKNLGKEVFPTKIKLNKLSVSARGQDKPLTPGMAAEGDIVMRRKSVLSLMLEPITRKFDGVFLAN
jgi:HlyD family secretion protein